MLSLFLQAEILLALWTCSFFFRQFCKKTAIQENDQLDGGQKDIFSEKTFSWFKDILTREQLEFKKSNIYRKSPTNINQIHKNWKLWQFIKWRSGGSVWDCTVYLKSRYPRQRIEFVWVVCYYWLLTWLFFNKELFKLASIMNWIQFTLIWGIICFCFHILPDYVSNAAF